ncbi:MAG: choice-of-anchor Q domain-containing protein, partial [Rhodanobacteraceae bacterium]
VKGSTTGGPICLDWYTDGKPSQRTTYTNNIIWKVKGNICPTGSLCRDPMLTNETTTAFNPTPLLGSPAIDSASRSYLLNHDQIETHRPFGPGYDIGAIEFRGQPCRAGSRRPRCRAGG